MQIMRITPTPFRLALLAALVYLVLRLALSSSFHQEGQTSGGPMSYDSYYQMAFANELVRTGHIFTFQNPFGTLDKTPKLTNLYASLLALCSPLFRKYPFGFDLVLSVVGVFVGSFFLLLLLGQVMWREGLLLLVGGSCAYLFKATGLLAPGPVSAATFWGLNTLLNQISTPEILYHALFFLGLWWYQKGSFWPLACLILLLGFLHPFTGMTFYVALSIGFFVETLKQKTMVNKDLRIFGVVLCSALLSILYFKWILPTRSNDASYFQHMYQHINFYIQWQTYLAFMLVPFLYLCVVVWFTKREASKELPTMFWIMLGTSLFCTLASMSYLLTNALVQPAHWSRMYPYAFMIGGAILYRQTHPLSAPVRARWVLSALLVIGLLDNGLAIASLHKRLSKGGMPHIVSTEEQKLLGHLGALPSSKIIVFYECSDHKVGLLEYTLASRTLHRVLYGHTIFSPHFTPISRASRNCRPQWRPPPQLLHWADYVILAPATATHLAQSPNAAIYRSKSHLVFRASTLRTRRKRHLSPAQREAKASGQPSTLPNPKKPAHPQD